MRSVLSELLRLAGPVVLARLGIMAMGLTDAIVVGRYSSEQLAFHALGWAPTATIVTAGVGLLMGVQVMTARYVGEGRREQTGGVLRRGVVYAFWLGLAATVALLLLGPLFMRSIGLAPGLAAGANRALVIFALSMTPYLVSVAATFWLEALSRPMPGMWAMWVANGVNLALALALVPGAFDLPPMGAVGAAWASFGARTALMVYLLLHIWRMADARDLGVFDRPSDSRADAIGQRRVGYGAGTSYFVESAAFAGMNIVAGWLGGLAVAAYTVVLNVAAVIFMVPLGLSAAAAVLVGRAWGARDPSGVRRAGWTGIGVAALFGLLVALAVAPFAEVISAAYTRDPALVALAAPALALFCLCIFADCSQVVAAGVLRARGDIWVPTATHMVSYAAVMCPLAWLLAHPLRMGVAGVIWAIIVSSLLSIGFLAARFWQLSRRDEKGAAPEGATPS